MSTQSEILAQFQDQIAAEHRKIGIKAFLINAFFAYYLAAAWVYLGVDWFGDWETDAGRASTLFKVLAGVALILGALWTKLESNSIGKLLMIKTSPILRVQKKPEGVAQKPFFKTFSGVATVVVLLTTFIFGWNLTEMKFYSLLSVEGVSGATRIFSALLQPETSILPKVLSEMMETIFIAFMATAIAVPIAFFAAFFSARNLMSGSVLSRSVYGILRFIFNFTRSMEPVVWAIIFSVWVGIGPFAGMMALMLHSVSSLAKLYSEAIEGINAGPVEAIESTGAGRVQTVWYAVVPQVILPYLGFTIYRWDINIRMATIIGLVGGGGIGTLLMQYQGLARWNEIGMIVIVIASVVWFMDYLSARIREAIY